jgi:hypothetical protein
VPYALSGTALLVLGQSATAKLDFQHLSGCCPFVKWDESENVIGYPALEDDALLVCHLITDSDPILSSCWSH